MTDVLPQSAPTSTSQPVDAASLDQMHDIVQLEAVSLWPTGEGWLVLLLVVLIFVGLWWLDRARRYRRDAFRRVALAELQALQQRAGEDPCAVVAAGNELLKRVAMVSHTRVAVAGLASAAWTDWLNQNGGEARFSDEHIRCLHESLYQAVPPEPEAVRGLLDAMAAWVRLHPGRGEVD